MLVTRADWASLIDAATVKDDEALMRPSNASPTLTVTRALLYLSRKARFIWSVKGFVKYEAAVRSCVDM